jgi:hypothetical protein
VNARDEDDLVDQLDMLDDPSGCKWQVYRAPLHIEIDLPIDYERKRNSDVSTGAPEDRYTITSAPEELGRNDVTLSVPSTDTADSMLDAIWRFAFPNLTKAIEENDLKLTDQQVKRYALKDLDVLAQSDWQRAQRDRSTDPDAKIARDLGTSVRQVKGILRRRREDSTAPVKPLKPKGSKRRLKRP